MHCKYLPANKIIYPLNLKAKWPKQNKVEICFSITIMTDPQRQTINKKQNHIEEATRPDPSARKRLYGNKRHERNFTPKVWHIDSVKCPNGQRQEITTLIIQTANWRTTLSMHVKWYMLMIYLKIIQMLTVFSYAFTMQRVKGIDQTGVGVTKAPFVDFFVSML